MTAAKRQEAEAEDVAPDQSGLRRMVSEPEVLKIVPVSRSTLLRMEKSGQFPKSFHLSPNRRAWFLDTIVDWQRAIAEHDPHFNPARGRGKGRRRRVSPDPT